MKNIKYLTIDEELQKAGYTKFDLYRMSFNQKKNALFSLKK